MQSGPIQAYAIEPHAMQPMQCNACNSQSLKKSLTPSEKFSTLLKEPQELPMRKSLLIPPLQKQFKTLPEKFLPPPRENCLTIAKPTSNNQTKSQLLPKNPNPREKISTPHHPSPKKKHFNHH